MIFDCAADGSCAGGLHAKDRANVTLKGGSRVLRCSSGRGGTIFAMDSDVVLLNGVFSECTAWSAGGAMHIQPARKQSTQLCSHQPVLPAFASKPASCSRGRGAAGPEGVSLAALFSLYLCASRTQVPHRSAIADGGDVDQQLQCHKRCWYLWLWRFPCNWHRKPCGHKQRMWHCSNHHPEQMKGAMFIESASSRDAEHRRLLWGYLRKRPCLWSLCGQDGRFLHQAMPHILLCSPQYRRRCEMHHDPRCHHRMQRLQRERGHVV